MHFSFRKYRDVILGCVMLAFGTFYLVTAQSIKTRPKLVSHLANARFVPTILGSLLIFLSILVLIKAIRYVKHYDPAAEKDAPKDDTRTVVLTFALILLYVMGMDPLGFIISSILYLFLQMMVLAPTEKRKPLVFAIVAVVFTLILYFAFRFGLDLILPAGLLVF